MKYEFRFQQTTLVKEEEEINRISKTIGTLVLGEANKSVGGFDIDRLSSYVSATRNDLEINQNNSDDRNENGGELSDVTFHLNQLKVSK